jgi:hemerythrin superfamily protein
MDAIKLLKQDHKSVEDLFKKFEKAGDRAYKTKRKLADQIITELSVHASIEEQVFYPGVRESVKGTEDVVLESLEEHHIVKWTLSELEGMDPEDERFDAKVTVLMESVRHHVKEEEQEMFPKVRKALGRAKLNDLGQRMERAKKAAPTRPHPRSPDEPPANLMAGPVAAVMDAGRDLAGGVVGRLKPGRGSRAS